MPDDYESLTSSVAKQGIDGALFVRLALLVGSVIVVIFGLFQVVEHTLLTAVQIQTLHTLHILRGVVSSIVVAVVVAWAVLRTTPAILPATAEEGENWPDLLTESDESLYYSRWFIRMRWIAILAAATLVFIAVNVTGLLSQEAWWPLAVSLLGLILSNLLFTLLLGLGKRGKRFLLLQACADLLFLTVLLHFSGGIENPLSLLPLVHVIVAGILLTKKQCYAVAGIAGTLFALLAWAEWAHVVEHYTLLVFPHGPHEEVHAAHQTLYVLSRTGLQYGLLFLSAYFVTALAEQSRAHKRRSARMAERALAERRLLERALETTSTGLRVVNRDLQPLWLNHWWKEWFGDGVENASQEMVTSVEKQILGDREIRMTEITAPEPVQSPNPRVYQVTMAPLLDSEGNLTAIVHLAQDMTEQKRTQVQMMRAGKMAAIGELASHVAHEVNNPIAIISAKARLLLSDRENEMSGEVAGEINKIVRLADRVAQIAQGLLSYCRPSAATRLPLDLCIPIRGALSMLDQRAATGHVRIQDQLGSQALPIVANLNELEQVFLNLFLNALDAMPQGGDLIIAACRRGSYVEVSVKDTGAGIPADLRDHIFEPFFTTKEEGRGAGLGLSICLGLIRSHKGEIQIHSDSGHGTEVLVQLPSIETERPLQLPMEDIRHA